VREETKGSDPQNKAGGVVVKVQQQVLNRTGNKQKRRGLNWILGVNYWTGKKLKLFS